MLLCDFHIHTNYSDGKLSVPEIIDFYGERGFDCICITDHLADPKRLIGKLSELANMTLSSIAKKTVTRSRIAFAEMNTLPSRFTATSPTRRQNHRATVLIRP
jgi:predicted metal-dependent phosphoesterase TrpH